MNRSVAVFGSVVRGTAHPDSDVDILIDIDPDVRFSLVDLVSLKEFLEERLKRSVDVVTRAGLDAGVKEQVLSQAERAF